nr:MAG TPA: hypothetical protein [Caudoviricetes sp.]
MSLMSQKRGYRNFCTVCTVCTVLDPFSRKSLMRTHLKSLLKTN